MNHKTYTFENYIIENDSFGKNLIVKDFSKINDINQKILFQQMLNHPEMNLETGVFSLTDEQIFLFWKSYKQEIVDYSSEEYFEALEFSSPYNKKIPYIKTEGAFSSENYKLKVVFCDGITKIGPLNPKAYQQEGFELLDFNGTSLGSLYPEFYELFYLVDVANQNWKNYTQNDRYDFIASVKKLSESRKILLPDFFEETEIEKPEKVKPNIIKTGEDSYKMILDFDDKEKTEQINKSLDERNEADNIYTVKIENKQTKIILSDEQKQVFKDIKQTKNFTKEELSNFIENPPENWNDDIIDTSELYGERVIGYGLISNNHEFNFKESIVDWFDGAELQVPIQNETKDSKEIENNKKFGLIIKENELDVSYEEQAKTLKNEFIFPKIESLKDSIQLKKYQKEGIAWLFTNFLKETPGVIFADDMGLGKTIQTLSFLHSIDEYYTSKNDNLISLVVAPVILLDNWIDENEKFFSSDLHFINGNIVKNELNRILVAQEDNRKKREVLLVSYEYLRTNQKELAKIDWDIIILDEAQKIKSSTTLISKAAKALKGRFRIALTGTPVENSFLDIWSIADFAIPGFLGSKMDFTSEFEIKNTDSDDEITEKGNKIRDKLGVFLLRRTKLESLNELPEKLVSNFSEDMPPVQLNTYKEAANLINRIDKSSLGGRLSVLQELKKVSDHPILFSETKLQKAMLDDSAKLIMLSKILKEIKEKDEKVIVFAEYYKSQELIAELITSIFGFTPDIVNGQTSISGYYSRKNLIERFSQKKGFNIIIMSPLAAGVGLTIVAANHVINYSRHWNPAKEDQAIDRVYRIGQKKAVYVYNLICTADGFKTFDQNLDRLLSVKRTIKQAALYPSDPPNIQKEMMNYFFDSQNIVKK